FENVIYEGKWKDDYVDIKLKIDQLLEVQQNFNIETWNDYRSISSISSYINSEDIGSLNEQEKIILRYELSKKDFDYELNPFEILFTQVQINSYFLDGIYIYDTINDLVSGNLKPEHLPIISVCILDNGQFYSVDNRRLFCYQQAILKNAKFTKVPVRIMRETDK
ncbi:23777_t:CDS:2, partial [Gigaspora rosea]